MCFGGGTPEGAPSEAQISNSIDKEIRQEEKKMNSQVKLLLLGLIPALAIQPDIIKTWALISLV